jgi:uncharacterized OB-fold protein
MNFFESELKKGNFMIPECLKCNDVIWPQSDYCSHCFSKISWRKSDGVGTILEFSKNKDNFFCLVEFDKKIRILGTLGVNSKPPEIHKKVKLENCKMDGKNYNFSLIMI